MEIFDLHNDFLTKIKSDKSKVKYLCGKKCDNLKTLIGAVWTTEMSSEKAIETIERCYDFIYEYNENFLNFFDDERLNQNRNQIFKVQNLLLGIEDMHFINKINLLRVINAHPAYCGLTWNYDNILAGGAHGAGTLTPYGIEVLETLEQNNIQIDTAHLNEKSFMAVAKLTTRPLFCSHTAIRSLVDNPRNLKDYQLKMIEESGGIVGIALVGSFLTEGKKSYINDVARHIDYVASRFSPEMVCLGTDFYGTRNLPKKIKSYHNLDMLENRLRLMGYDTETIEKIFYKNAKRFFNI